MIEKESGHTSLNSTLLTLTIWAVLLLALYIFSLGPLYSLYRYEYISEAAFFTYAAPIDYTHFGELSAFIWYMSFWPLPQAICGGVSFDESNMEHFLEVAQWVQHPNDIAFDHGTQTKVSDQHTSVGGDSEILAGNDLPCSE
jgi:hypothetical protein